MALGKRDGFYDGVLLIYTAWGHDKRATLFTNVWEWSLFARREAHLHGVRPICPAWGLFTLRGGYY